MRIFKCPFPIPEVGHCSSTSSCMSQLPWTLIQASGVVGRVRRDPTDSASSVHGGVVSAERKAPARFFANSCLCRSFDSPSGLHRVSASAWESWWWCGGEAEEEEQGWGWGVVCGVGGGESSRRGGFDAQDPLKELTT